MKSCHLIWTMEVPNMGNAETAESALPRSLNDIVRLSKLVATLEGEKADLQQLVCELLSKNEELRRRIWEMTSGSSTRTALSENERLTTHGLGSGDRISGRKQS